MPGVPLPDQTFAGGTLDRAAHRRTPAEYDWARRSPQARLILVGDGPSIGVDHNAALVRVAMHEHQPPDPILLGFEDDAALFAAAAPEGADGLEHLRQAVSQLSPAEAALGAYAGALIGWQRTHVFCGRCGAETERDQAGHCRRCPRCGLTAYPRTDPVVTMLVEDGERCVLTRRQGAIADMWSALAGFIEPGETPEEAVVRETLEEVGIGVASVEYVGAQPWPFPGALMLGFRAFADPETVDAIAHQPEELTDARWFTRDELRTALHARTMTIPPPLAIGHHLIAGFLSRADGE